MLARRFALTGHDEAAIATAGWLHDSLGISASLSYLGEYVDDAAAVDRTVEANVDAVHLLRAARLDVHVSVDPTSIGYLRGDELCQGNAVSPCRSAPTGGPTRSAASARVPKRAAAWPSAAGWRAPGVTKNAATTCGGRPVTEDLRTPRRASIPTSADLVARAISASAGRIAL
jgi:hypothetical protein